MLIQFSRLSKIYKDLNENSQDVNELSYRCPDALNHEMIGFDNNVDLVSLIIVCPRISLFVNWNLLICNKLERC